MNGLPTRLARPEILALPDVGSLAGEPEEYADGVVRLHLNESGFEPLGTAQGIPAVNRYPEPRVPALRLRLADLYGVRPNELVVTRGADDAIDILIRSFCRPGVDAIATAEPTFGAYALFAQIQGAQIVRARLRDDFGFNSDCFIEAVRRQPAVKLAFLCSPNNPTGNLISPEDVLKVADGLPETIVVIDEAYIEFAESRSCIAEAPRRDNLVVLRTLSKAYGLAGARVGCAIASAELIDIVSRALPPYPLAAPSVSLALSVLAPSRRLLLEERISQIKAERARMAERLADSPLVSRVWPSHANFLLIEASDPERIRGELRCRGLKVRWRPDIATNVLRLTVGTREDNALALAAFGVETSVQQPRRAETIRDTKETRIALAIDLDRALPRKIQSGIPFFDHMLDQVAAHGGFSLVLACDGDREVDAHHSLEDCALALGQAFSKALGARTGIGRYGFALPMDEARATVLIDLSGRPYVHFEGKFNASHIGDYPTEMTQHIFRSLAHSIGASIHVQVTGENDHHKTEACFKALGRALSQAIAQTGSEVPSTKGILA